MRILNMDALTNHGNRKGRQHMAEILEAGLSAADPYRLCKMMFRIDEENKLHVGHEAFVPLGAPYGADEVYAGRGEGRMKRRSGDNSAAFC